MENGQLRSSGSLAVAGSTDRVTTFSLDGKSVSGAEGELLIEAILRETQIPHVCYHSALMGPIQTCDTCMVEVNGKLVRACGTNVSAGLKVLPSRRALGKLRPMPSM